MGNQTHLACRILGYNQDIQRGALLDAHIDTHLPQNNNHTLRTTNIRAFFADCIHAETRRHRLFYITHVANVCTQSKDVPCRVGVLAAVSVVESFEQRVMCVVEDNVVVREGNPRELVPSGIFDHLCSVS